MKINELVCEYCLATAECTDPKKWFEFADEFWSKHDDCLDFRYIYSIKMRKKKGGELTTI